MSRQCSCNLLRLGSTGAMGAHWGAVQRRFWPSRWAFETCEPSINVTPRRVRQGAACSVAARQVCSLLQVVHWLASSGVLVWLTCSL